MSEIVEKHAGGRPTKYEDWMCDAVIEYAEQGLCRYEIAAKLRVCRDTINEWAQKHPQFSAALKRAKECAVAHWAGEIRANMYNKSYNHSLAIYLGKAIHHLYDRPSETTHTIKIANIEKLTDDELDELTESAK